MTSLGTTCIILHEKGKAILKIKLLLKSFLKIKYLFFFSFSEHKNLTDCLKDKDLSYNK